MITLEAHEVDNINNTLKAKLIESNVLEFKWKNLDSARYRFAAEKLIDVLLQYVLESKLRIDTLIWDVEDSRHKVRNRDDSANLGRMYFHLYKNVLRKRWPSNTSWCLYPDRNSLIDWGEMEKYLTSHSLNYKFVENAARNVTNIKFFKEFDIERIKEISAKDTPICQVADMFAGLGSFSWMNSGSYSAWLAKAGGQMQFFEDLHPLNFSNSEEERYKFLTGFMHRCKSYRLSVHLSSNSGLETYGPGNRINFWLYRPQRQSDKAPVRSLWHD